MIDDRTMGLTVYLLVVYCVNNRLEFDDRYNQTRNN